MDKKPKLEFICTSPGVEQVMPIIRASEYKHSWITKAVADMKSNGSIAAPHRQDHEMPTQMPGQKDTDKEERHTAKCPALQMVQNTGWIMRLHQDIKLKTFGDGIDLNFTIPFQSQQDPIVSKHLTHSFYPFFENWPKDTMKKIIKINLPWHARIPKGYKLLQTHPFLLDDNKFTTLSGVLDPHLGIASVGTIPMFWHCVDDEKEITLKAGTPLAQFILIPKEEPDFTQVDVNEDPKFQKEYRMNQLLLAGTFNRSYSKVKEFWKSYGW
jgi:hypothetical protein